MDNDRPPQPPKNLRNLVILMAVQLGVLVLASWFELLIETVATRVKGYGHPAEALLAALICTGLAVGFGFLALPLLRGQREAFKRTGILLAAELVAFIAIMCFEGSEPGDLLSVAMLAGIVIGLMCGRLYLLPDVAAYIAYHDAVDAPVD